MGNEFWITFAEDEAAAVGAVILYRSLQKLRTTKQFLAIVGPNVTPNLRMELERCCSWIIPVTQEEIERSLAKSFEAYATLYCWSIFLADTLVLVHPNCVALRNFDEIFKSPTELIGSSPGKSLDPRLMVIKPSPVVHLQMLNQLASIHGGAKLNLQKFTEYLKAHRKLGSIQSDFGMMELYSEQEDLTNEKQLVLVLFPAVDEPNPGSSFSQKMVEFRTKLFLQENLGRMDQDPWGSMSLLEKEPIAIIGMSYRLPMSSTEDEFWSLLMNKKDAIQVLPSTRWTSKHGCRLTPGRKATEAGFLSQPVDTFDCNFFSFSFAEIEFVDPQQRLLLEVTWEALEDAAIDPSTLHNREVSVYTGLWRNDYRHLLNTCGPEVTGGLYRKYMGTAVGTTTSRIAHFLGITGPNIATESGCSSSIVAVGLAMESLRQGTSCVALAGGVNLLLEPYEYLDFKGLQSPESRCKVFDSEANGFVRSEGCGVFALKTLKNAIKDGDRIHALLRGYGVGQEGPSKSMGTPTVDVEAMAMKQALKEGGVRPEDVQYVEAHGTGTAVGDPLEIKAVSKVYGVKTRKEPLIIGSVKGNIGHTESCSGVAGIIKTILSMKYEIIPPQINLNKLNPKINLQEIPAIIPLKPVEWKRTYGKRRIAGISSFGITGTDGHVIIEEPPLPSKVLKQLQMPLPGILALSAKSEEALKSLLKRYEEQFLSNSEVPLRSICYTANKGRQHFPIRATILANSTAEIVTKLQSKSYALSKPSAGPLKICFLYPGQGSQYYGMGRDLYKSSPVFRRHFDTVNMLIKPEIGICLKEVIWGADQELINQGLSSQLSIFAIEYCLTQLWASWGIQPDAVLGHSFGEYAAAVCAGIFTLSDAVKLLIEGRRELLQSLPPGKMVVLKADSQKTMELINEFLAQNRTSWLDVAAHNSAEQTVVSGEPMEVSKFSEFCNSKNVKTHQLVVNYAFHSRALDVAMPAFSKLARSITYRKSKCDYISGVDGKIACPASGSYWARQTRNKVQFQEASVAALDANCTVFLEVGGHPVLSPLILKNSAEIQKDFVCTPSMRKNTSEWKTMMEAVSELYLQGVGLNWEAFYRDFQSEIVSLPFYPFQRKFHWFTPEFTRTQSSSLEQCHPLLGKQIAIPPQNDMSIYQNFLKFDQAAYIFEHKVGSQVIFPAAGYLEMSFAACKKPSIPITVSNFIVNAALPIYSENEQIELQTISKGSTIEVWSGKHNIEDQEGKLNWVKHSTCSFNSDEDYKFQSRPWTLPSLLKEFTRDESAANIYAVLDSLGYHFGPTFQSAKKAFRNNQDKSDVLMFVEAPLSDQYQFHPILIDIMLQSAVFSKFRIETLKSLVLPLGVKKFTLLDPTGCNSMRSGWVHAYSGGSIVDFYSPEGSLLASCEGMEFVQSSLQALEKLFSVNSTRTPLYEEKWKSTDFQIRMGYQAKQISSTIVFDEVENYVNYGKEMVESLNALKKAAALGVQSTLLELGMEFGPSGTQLTLDGVIERCGILPSSKRFLWRLLNWVEEHGFLIRSSDGESFISTGRPAPNIALLKLEVENMTQKYGNGVAAADWKAYMKYVEMLGEFLRGTSNPFEICFPEESKDQSFSAETIYNHTAFCKAHRDLIGAATSTLISGHLQPLQKLLGRPIRILEIGAGTGTATRVILSLLEENGLPFSYTFTDISPSFFPKAEKTLKNHLQHLTFVSLDIEKDPLTQGFCPWSYDLIISLNVLHATKDLQKTCKNVRVLLNPSGILLNAETFQPDRMFDLFVGHFDGYWRFTDYELRKRHCIINQTQWDGVLKTSGFCETVALEDPLSHLGVLLAQASVIKESYIPEGNLKEWILLSDGTSLSSKLSEDLSLAGRKVHVFEIDKIENAVNLLKLRPSLEGILCLWGKLQFAENDYQGPKNALNEFLTVLKQLVNSDTGVQILLVSEGNQFVEGTDELMNPPWPSLLVGAAISFQTEVKLHKLRFVDIDCSSEDLILPVDEILKEMFSSGKEVFVAYRKGVRYVHRLQQFKSPAGPFSALTIPSSSSRYRLKLPSTKSIADLSFESCPDFNLGEYEIEVEVRSASLNFRDILSVLKPTDEFDKSNTVAGNFAGVVTSVGRSVSKRKLGDAVLGLSMISEPFQSHFKIAEDLCVNLPPSWTFSDGATLPTAFVTAYHCLIDSGKLQKGEFILIHTASGGVGLCALQIASNIGAKIIATAGSRRKRAYLKSLGVEHVSSSRDLKFGEDIHKITWGKGVNLVLNSLTGPGFKETSLKACAEGARFIEMSKLNIWSLDEVRKIRPDVKYSIEDLGHQGVPTVPVLKPLFAALENYISQGLIKPLTYFAFEAAEIRNALSFMERAKHIGKVVVQLPILNEHGKFATQMFNDRSTYLVTGGLSGIGFEMAKWICEDGGKHVVLCGRRPPADKIQKELETLRQMGKFVEVRQLDIGDFTACQELFDWIEMSMPPLRGVMHVAGVLADGAVMNQTKERFAEALRPKMDGAMNLHRLTKQMNLEHFVMFSSMVAVFGNPGQSNYAAGNKYMDSLASYRYNQGLPGLSINWGQWSEVGMVTHLSMPGFKPMTTLQGINAVEFLMRSHATTALASSIDFSIWANLIPLAKVSLSDVLKLNTENQSDRLQENKFKVSPEAFDREIKSLLEENEKLDIISKYVEELLKQVLKFEGKITPVQRFDELGLDSLMAIEFKNLLQQLLGQTFPISTTDIQEGNCLQLLTKRIFSLMKF